jgi:hypothetical protein
MADPNTFEDALYHVDPAPRAPGMPAEAVAAWAEREFLKLQAFLRRPEFAGVVFVRFASAAWEEFKPQDGMMIYVGPGVLGPQEGFYVRESGSWRKVAGT